MQRQRSAAYCCGCAFAKNMRQAFLCLVTQEIAVNATAKNEETGPDNEKQKDADRQKGMGAAREKRTARTARAGQKAVLAIGGKTLDSFHLPLAEADFLRFLCQQPRQNKSAIP